MKVKLLAAGLATLFLYNLASAQGYDIRTTGRNNLRAAPSLDGAFLETVPSGTVLTVIGELNRWLKISRNGAEVWMADWVGYTRVEGGEAAASQPVSSVPAQVDNCCFVDRQCNTPADWESGYWAFQNGQCVAPVQSQSSAAQPVSNVPAQADNCCFVDRQCHSAQDWESGYWAFQNGQCPVTTVAQSGAAASSAAPSSAAIPLSTSYMTEGVRRFLADPATDPFNNCCHMRYQDKDCSGDAEWEAGYWAFQNRQCIPPAPLGSRPAIVGNATFVNVVERALDLIAIHAPDWLNYIYNSGSLKIDLHPSGGANGFLNRTWTIASEDRVWMPDQRFLAGFAGFIAHEACHAIQQRTYSPVAGLDQRSCLRRGAVGCHRGHQSQLRGRLLAAGSDRQYPKPERWWW